MFIHVCKMVPRNKLIYLPFIKDKIAFWNITIIYECIYLIPHIVDIYPVVLPNHDKGKILKET